MLVLSRRVNESIVIADNIKVTVLEVRGDHVRIGIDAPRSVAVHRQEVHDELIRANQEAAASAKLEVGGLPRVPPPPPRPKSAPKADD